MPSYTGGEIISKYLIKEGVKHVVGIPGHGCLALVDAFYKNKDQINFIQPNFGDLTIHHTPPNSLALPRL